MTFEPVFHWLTVVYSEKTTMLMIALLVLAKLLLACVMISSSLTSSSAALSMFLFTTGHLDNAPARTTMIESNKTPLSTVALVIATTSMAQFLLSYCFNMTSALTPEFTSLWDIGILMIGLMYAAVAVAGVAWMYAANKLLPLGISRVYMGTILIVIVGQVVSFGAALTTINDIRKFFLLGGQIISSSSVAASVCIDSIQIDAFRNPTRRLPFSLIGSTQIIADQLGWFAAYLTIPLLVDVSMAVAMASVFPIAMMLVASVIGTSYFFDGVVRDEKRDNQFLTGAVVASTPMRTVYALAATGVAMGALDVFRRFMSPIWMVAFELPPYLVDQQIAWFILPGIVFSLLVGLMGWNRIALMIALFLSFGAFSATAIFIVVGNGTVFGSIATGGFAKEAAMCFVCGNALFGVLVSAATPLAVAPKDTIRVCAAIEVMRMVAQAVFSLMFGVLIDIGWRHVNVIIVMGIIIAGSSAAAFYTLMYIPKESKKDESVLPSMIQVDIIG